MSTIRPALVLLLLFTFLTGALYPAGVTAAAQALFPAQANGSLIESAGAPSEFSGSRAIGQPFSSPKYFWSRPSATSPTAYNGASSSGSNLGPLNPALLEAVKQRVIGYQESSAGHEGPVPIDLVTSSGSGLDPHISPAGALYQVERVAKARGLAVAQIHSLVEAQIEPRTLGIFGEPRVNVLALNLALDTMR